MAQALARAPPGIPRRARMAALRRRRYASPRGALSVALCDSTGGGIGVSIVHNTAQQRFELDVEGETVFTEYRLSPGVMTFFHTLTPRALRGRGLAGKVVQAALEFARLERLKVIPLCWYVNEHIKAHPEFRELLAPQSA
jgi:uncharacterized protein